MYLEGVLVVKLLGLVGEDGTALLLRAPPVEMVVSEWACVGENSFIDFEDLEKVNLDFLTGVETGSKIGLFNANDTGEFSVVDLDLSPILDVVPELRLTFLDVNIEGRDLDEVKILLNEVLMLVLWFELLFFICSFNFAFSSLRD